MTSQNEIEPYCAIGRLAGFGVEIPESIVPWTELEPVHIAEGVQEVTRGAQRPWIGREIVTAQVVQLLARTLQLIEPREIPAALRPVRL